MALDFPTSPTNGQYYNGFVYNLANDTWDSAYAPRAATIPLAGTNVIINGAFDIWQRGEGLSTATSASTGYVADRWQMFRDGYASGGATYRPSGPTGFRSAARVQRNAGNTSLAGVVLAQSIESLNSIPYAGKNVVLSFYARAGANYSSSGSSLTASVVSGTGTDQNVSNGLTGQASVLGGNVVLTTSWQRFTMAGAVSASANQLAVSLYYSPTGTAGASDYFEVTGVQLEEGVAATDFKRNAPSIQAELAACQRYYYEDAAIVGTGFNAYFVARCNAAHPVEMRTSPTVTVSAASNFFQMGNTGLSSTGTISNYSNARYLQADINTVTLSTNGFVCMHVLGSSYGRVTVSAEL